LVSASKDAAFEQRAEAHSRRSFKAAPSQTMNGK
jgi:hypothetical protein